MQMCVNTTQMRSLVHHSRGRTMLPPMRQHTCAVLYVINLKIRNYDWIKHQRLVRPREMPIILRTTFFFDQTVQKHSRIERKCMESEKCINHVHFGFITKPLSSTILSTMFMFLTFPLVTILYYVLFNLSK